MNFPKRNEELDWFAKGFQLLITCIRNQLQSPSLLEVGYNKSSGERYQF